MYWKVAVEPAEAPESFEAAGRFVVHRHTDMGGEHVDVRLEEDGRLTGWRVDAVSLEAEAWASEKAPHPLAWLEDDRDAVRLDAGAYAWERIGPDGGTALLKGCDGFRRLRAEKIEALPVRAARELAEVAAREDVGAEDLARLAMDGLAARRRSVERLCGLGRELDGEAFAEGVWRKSLRGLPLEEVHEQLRAFELRFDAKYPPQPVSRSETRGDEDGASRGEEAMAIVRG